MSKTKTALKALDALPAMTPEELKVEVANAERMMSAWATSFGENLDGVRLQVLGDGMLSLFAKQTPEVQLQLSEAARLACSPTPRMRAVTDVVGAALELHKPKVRPS